MDETFICEHCGNVTPLSRMKEVKSERGQERIVQNFCPHCLDQVLQSSQSVRGVVGEEKSAAVHVSPTPSP